MVHVGDAVGAGRCPPAGPPWMGILLAVDDPRAWAGTLAFPRPAGADVDWEPEAAAVKAHVAKCAAQGDVITSVPVLWDFKTYRRVWWERPESLRPYAEEHEEWKQAITTTRELEPGEEC